MPVGTTCAVPLVAGRPTASKLRRNAVPLTTASPKGKRKKSDLNQRRPRQYCPPKPVPNPPRTRAPQRRRAVNIR